MEKLTLKGNESLILLWVGKVVICQVQMHAYMIAVSLAFPKDQKSSYIMGPPRVSNVRNLLRGIVILVHSNIGIFDIS